MAHIGGLGHGPVHENDPNRININNNEDINFEAILAEFEDEITPKKVNKSRLSEINPGIDVKRPFYTNSINDSIPGVDKNEKITHERYKQLDTIVNKIKAIQLPNL